MGMQQKWRQFKNDVTVFLLHIPSFQYLRRGGRKHESLPKLVPTFGFRANKTPRASVFFGEGGGK